MHILSSVQDIYR